MPAKLAAVLHRGAAATPGERDVQITRAPQPDVLQFRIEFAPRRRRASCLPASSCSPLDRVRDALVDVASPAPHVLPRSEQFNAASFETERRVGDQPGDVERVDLAQTVAFQAHALRAVETEQLRTGRLEADAAVRTGVVDRQHQVCLAPFGTRSRSGADVRPCRAVDLRSWAVRGAASSAVGR